MSAVPFDGVNPNSVVIIDNCSIHHTSEVISAIQDTGAILHFLPPYSPDWNSAEGAFSKVKTMMKAMEMEMQTIEDIDTIIYAAFSFITRGQRAWCDFVIYTTKGLSIERIQV